MSFSSEIKEELSKISNLGNKTQVRQELIGYLISVNSNIIAGKQIRYATESEYNINRFSKLLANLEIHHNIEIEGNVFVITLKSKEIGFIEMKENQITIQQEQKVTKAEGREKTKEQEENKALIRGAFLGAGSINNPENTYHLEMIFFTSRKCRND